MSGRNEFEISDINKIYLDKGNLNVQLMGEEQLGLILVL